MTRLPMLLAPVLLGLGGLAVAACAPMDRAPVTPTTPADGPSECKADIYSAYVGRNRSELPAKPANETWRVLCTTCPMTMDYNPERLNIVFEETSGVIREVKCG